MTTVAQAREQARSEKRVTQLERDLAASRMRQERCERRCNLLEQLVRAQASLLLGLRKGDHKRVGGAIEQMTSVRRQLRSLYER